MSELTVRPEVLRDPPISDGEYIHLLQIATTNAERNVIVRRMVLKKFAEVGEMTNFAFALAEDRDAAARTVKSVAIARDAAIEGLRKL